MRRSLLFSTLLAFVSGAAAQPLISQYSVRSPNSQSDGFFGNSVEAIADLDSDGVGDFIVGAPNESGQSGRVHLFSGASGAVIRTLASPQPTAGTSFGVSIADVGDIDGDGTHDLAAGGYFTVGGNAAAGRVYLFSGASGAEIRALESPASQTNGFFGFNVAGPGDLNGDGTPDVVVGAGDEDVMVGGSTVVDHGAVYAFSGADGSLLWRSTPDTPEAGIFYGRVVPMGDLTGDGVPELLTAAVLADNASGVESGLAYVVDGATGAFVFTLQPGSNAQTNGFFGNTLAGLDDFDADGIPDIGIGSPFEGVGGTSVRDGTVSFYRGSDGSLVGTYALDERQAERGFGWEVQNLGDIDRDGVGDIGISAVRQFNRFQHRPPPLTLPFSGAVFVYSGADIGQQIVNNIAEVYPSLPAFPTTFSWRYGEDFASVGDVNGDGLPDLAIGAPTQGNNIGFTALIPGDRILSISDASVEAEESVSATQDGTYDFGDTGIDLDLDGVSTSAPFRASGKDAASGGKQASGETLLARDGRAAGGALGTPEAAFAFASSGGDGNLRVQRFSTAPSGREGITESNVSAYRWIVATEGPFRWEPTSEMRFALGEIPSSGITNPETVVVYVRETLAAGAFEALATTYDADADEIMAMLPRVNGAFTGEFALASDSNPLPTEGASEAAFTLRTFPNPARGFATASVTLDAPEAVTVAVFDALGREVARLHDGPLAPGTHTLALDAHTLPSGLYLVRATGESGQVSRQLTVVR